MQGIVKSGGLRWGPESRWSEISEYDSWMTLLRKDWSIRS